MSQTPVFKDDISVVLCGAAGQGVQTVEQLLTHLLKQAGYNLYSTKEYMSRVRGGSNSTELRVASYPVQAYVDRIDILFPLNREALNHVAKRITPSTVILGERAKLVSETDDSYTVIDIPLTDIAGEIGGAIFSNIIATGVIAALFGIERSAIDEYLKKRFGSKGESIVTKNIEAAGRGCDIGDSLLSSGRISVELETNDTVGDDIIISGGEAIGMGAIAGGCNFISSYPMTPSTPVLTFLAGQSNTFSIIAEQAEDEIAAVNMAIGAWYAGARAMVTTSGGGFALMEEGISLAGIIESPLVVHLAQRPGPATGLPTRTEQGDLDLVLYSGHGEFPRVIYAPGDLNEAFHLTRKAFEIADTYQIPVFLLTDQYLIDSYYNIQKLDISGINVENHIVRTGKDYRRYSLTETGISPRGVPGYGEGLVVVDSDEHDEYGHITEDHDVRVCMVDKRLRKIEPLIDEALPPKLLGSSDYTTLIVCWGSTYTVVREAVDDLGRDDIALLHFSQVYPLHRDTAPFFERAKRTIVIEGNATSQFARILKIHAGIEEIETITKYNGLAFSVEEVVAELNGIL